MLWDVATKEARTLEEQEDALTSHKNYVTSVAFSKDGKWLASASGDKTAKLWDVTTGRVLFPLVGHGDVITSVAFSPDGARLASSSGDRTVKLWDATALVETQQPKVPESVATVLSATKR